MGYCYLDLYTLKFGFARIPKTLVIEDSQQKTYLLQRQFSEFKGLVGENPSSLVH
jgi:hypothetical protein